MSLPYDSRQSRFTSYLNFQKFIDTKKVLCKCGKIISLGNTYQISNFQRHFQSNNCTYRTNNQPSINVFFSKSKPGGNKDNGEKNDSEENRKRCTFMCQGLCDLEYINYIINSPASFGSGKRPEIREEFERELKSEATWHLDKEVLAGQAISSIVKFTLCHYYNEPLLKLLKNSNLWQILASTSNENNDAEFWTKLAQFGLSGAFDGDVYYLKAAVNMKFLEKLLLDFQQIRKTDSIIITNPDLVIENFIKFSQIKSKLNYIAGSILPHSETTIEVLEDVYPKINYILEKNAIATQVRDIALKVPIGKVPPMMVAMIPTKGNEEAEQIASDGARSEFNAQSIITNESTTNYIQEYTRIVFNEATSLTKYIHIRSGEEFSIFTHIERMTDIEDDESVEEEKLTNISNDKTSLNHSITVGNVALEITRILSDLQNKNDLLYEEEILEEEDDDNIMQQLPSVEEFPDIQYIIQHSSIPISFNLF
ncbi:17729_t:CDS:10 [Funneliformis geosporum]|nr:17729_t:CDS:10 [Funneliformis geosporum]